MIKTYHVLISHIFKIIMMSIYLCAMQCAQCAEEREKQPEEERLLHAYRLYDRSVALHKRSKEVASSCEGATKFSIPFRGQDALCYLNEGAQPVGGLIGELLLSHPVSQALKLCKIYALKVYAFSYMNYESGIGDTLARRVSSMPSEWLVKALLVSYKEGGHVPIELQKPFPLQYSSKLKKEHILSGILPSTVILDIIKQRHKPYAEGSHTLGLTVSDTELAALRESSHSDEPIDGEQVTVTILNEAVEELISYVPALPEMDNSARDAFLGIK